MNIMHVLSQTHLTGAEVYAAQLIEEQSAQGQKVYQISNGFFTPTRAEQFPLPVETKGAVSFLKNVLWLRKFLRGKNIHVVHTHSRAAAKLVYWARAFLKVAMVSTVHGRQHPSFSKKLFNQYGDFLIPVSETIQRQLSVDFKYLERRMAVVRNPIELNTFKFQQAQPLDLNNLKIAVIGRTTGPKGTRTEQILNALPDQLRLLGVNATYFLVGGFKNDLKLNSDLIVTEKQIASLTGADYQKYDLVIGSGRVAVESLLTGVPTISFGEAKYMGLVNLDNLNENYISNFGDMDSTSHTPTLNPEQLAKDLTKFLQAATATDAQELSLQVAREFSAKKISRRIQRLYESAFFIRNFSRWIPILMYHKIPSEELQSQHKIFVTKDRFRKHLQFFKILGFKTITFSDLKKFKSGAVDFSQFPKKPLLLTFDDGYKDNLEHASPLLKEFGFKAQLFLLANSDIASNQWDHSATELPHEIISGSDRQKWKTSAFEIGSHGFSHQKISAMTEAEARLELRKSKNDLEAEFKCDIPVYAFTYGDTSLQAAQWAFEEGYDYAVNTDTGGLNIEENPHQIFRVNIFPNETFLSLWKKTSSWYRNYYFQKRKK